MRRVMLGRRGQAVVEFALVLPLVLIMVISVFEFARAWNIQQVLTDAAREATRVAVVSREQPEATIRSRIETAVSNALSVAAIDRDDVEVSVIGIPSDRGEPVTVQLELNHRFFFLGPMMGWTTGKSTLSLGTSITMRNE